jgi:arsenite methyltransferase
MSQLEFDADQASKIEALYRIGDAARRRRIVREALRAAPAGRILDVGCGPGFYCAELAEEVGPQGSVVGVDSSPAMLQLGARRCAGHEGVELRQADAVSLPVDDGSFDAALCVQVLEYVRDPTAALAEMHRALRPGGRVVVWDIDWATVSLHSPDPARTERALRAWDEHLVHPSLPRTLGPRLRSAGFEEVRMEAHPFASCEFDPETYGPPWSRWRGRSWSGATGSPTRRPRPGSPSSSSSATVAPSTSPARSSASRRRSSVRQAMRCP